MGPSAIRIAGIGEKLVLLGHKLNDLGDIATKIRSCKNYQIKIEILARNNSSCKILSNKVQRSLSFGNFPLVLGGDHSIAIGTIAGLANFCKSKKETWRFVD